MSLIFRILFAGLKLTNSFKTSSYHSDTTNTWASYLSSSRLVRSEPSDTEEQNRNNIPVGDCAFGAAVACLYLEPSASHHLPATVTYVATFSCSFKKHLKTHSFTLPSYHHCISRESWTTRNVLWSRAYVCLSVCLSVHGRMPTLLHGPGCNLGEW